MIQIDCLKAGKHAPNIPLHPDTRTQVYFENKYYQYSNQAEEVKAIWEAEGFCYRFHWETIEIKGGITYLNAERGE